MSSISDAPPSNSHRPEFRVLLVGDPEAGCGKLEGLLRNLHLEVVQASTSRQASPYIAQGAASVVITDAQLPDGDWARVVQEAQHQPYAPSVIVVSGNADWTLWAAVISAGGFDVLAKPWTVDSVVWMVQSAYRRSQRTREVEAARRSNAFSEGSPSSSVDY